MAGAEAQESFAELAHPTWETAAFHQMDAYIQHGTTTTMEHCVAVAATSLALSRHLPVRFHERELVCGALLHDYFLYDWHVKGAAPDAWHGFTHPYHALANAERDFSLTPIERDVISHHMFPFVPIPPHTREGWIVTVADKWCTVREVLISHPYAALERSLGWKA